MIHMRVEAKNVELCFAVNYEHGRSLEIVDS